MKLSTASTLLAASAAAAVIGMGAPAFASTSAVAHPAKPACVGFAVDECGIGAEGFVGEGHPFFAGEHFSIHHHFFPHRRFFGGDDFGVGFNQFDNGFFDESDCFNGGF